MNKKLLFFCLLLIFGCKKEKKEDQINSIHPIESSPPDSLNRETTSANLNNQGISIDGSRIKMGLGKTVFSENNQPLFYFDNNSHDGEIIINKKSYELTSISFSENNYELEGNGIKITAENGDFSERSSDCINGKFPSIQIIIGNLNYTLKDINVQDCSQ